VHSISIFTFIETPFGGATCSQQKRIGSEGLSKTHSSWPTLVRHSKRFLLPGKGGMRQDDRHVGKIDRHVLKIKSAASPGASRPTAPLHAVAPFHISARGDPTAWLG
jgi:hypothetical protein